MFGLSEGQICQQVRSDLQREGKPSHYVIADAVASIITKNNQELERQIREEIRQATETIKQEIRRMI